MGEIIPPPNCVGLVNLIFHSADGQNWQPDAETDPPLIIPFGIFSEAISGLQDQLKYYGEESYPPSIPSDGICWAFVSVDTQEGGWHWYELHNLPADVTPRSAVDWAFQHTLDEIAEARSMLAKAVESSDDSDEEGK